MDDKNQLYFGDNLRILREYVPDASVDHPLAPSSSRRGINFWLPSLVRRGNRGGYDPPFNSSATYNVVFKEKSGEESAAQIMAFEDTWQWSQEAEAVYREIVESGPRKLADLMQALPGWPAVDATHSLDCEHPQGRDVWNSSGQAATDATYGERGRTFAGHVNQEFFNRTITVSQ